MKALKALQEFSGYVTSMIHIITSKQISFFEIVKIEMPELPKVKYAIAFDVHHCLLDGSSITRFFRYFN